MTQNVLNLNISLERINILTMLNFPVHKYSIHVYCLSLLPSPAETVRSGMTLCSAEESTPLGSTVAGLEAEAGIFGWAGGKNHFRLE